MIFATTGLGRLEDKAQGGDLVEKSTQRSLIRLWSRRESLSKAQQCECTSCHRAVHLKMVKLVNFMLSLFYHNKKLQKKKSQAIAHTFHTSLFLTI